MRFLYVMTFSNCYLQIQERTLGNNEHFQLFVWLLINTFIDKSGTCKANGSISW